MAHIQSWRDSQPIAFFMPFAPKMQFSAAWHETCFLASLAALPHNPRHEQELCQRRCQQEPCQPATRFGHVQGEQAMKRDCGKVYETDRMSEI